MVEVLKAHWIVIASSCVGVLLVIAVYRDEKFRRESGVPWWKIPRRPRTVQSTIVGLISISFIVLFMSVAEFDSRVSHAVLPPSKTTDVAFMVILVLSARWAYLSWRQHTHKRGSSE